MGGIVFIGGYWKAPGNGTASVLVERWFLDVREAVSSSPLQQLEMLLLLIPPPPPSWLRAHRQYLFLWGGHCDAPVQSVRMKMMITHHRDEEQRGGRGGGRNYHHYHCS